MKGEPKKGKIQDENYSQFVVGKKKQKRKYSTNNFNSTNLSNSK